MEGENRITMMTLKLSSGAKVAIEPCVLHKDSYEVYRIRVDNKFLNFKGQLVEFTGDNQEELLRKDNVMNEDNIVCFIHLNEAVNWVVYPYKFVDEDIDDCLGQRQLTEGYLAFEPKTDEIVTLANEMLEEAEARLLVLEALKETGLK